MILFGTTIGYVFEDQPYRPQISQHPAGISPTKMGISPPTIGNYPAKIADDPPKTVDLPSANQTWQWQIPHLQRILQLNFNFHRTDRRYRPVIYNLFF